MTPVAESAFAFLLWILWVLGTQSRHVVHIRLIYLSLMTFPYITPGTVTTKTAPPGILCLKSSTLPWLQEKRLRLILFIAQNITSLSFTQPSIFICVNTNIYFPKDQLRRIIYDHSFILRNKWTNDIRCNPWLLIHKEWHICDREIVIIRVNYIRVWALVT